jgi:hypothetical protein
MDEHYRKLVDGLKKACEEPDPFLRRISAVIDAIDFLTANAVPRDLIKPLNDVIDTLINMSILDQHGNKSGPKPKPWSERCKVGFAAAIVTALRSCGWRVGDATKHVGKTLNIDQKWLRQMRDNLHRGIGDPVTLEHYCDGLEELEQARGPLEDEALSHLQLLSSW